jgi:hypothetical protein
MRFTILPILAVSVISNVLAAPTVLAGRDTSVIENGMKRVTTSLRQLAVEIRILNPNRPQDLILKQEAAIDSMADEVVRVLQDETRNIKTRAATVGAVEVLRLTEGINAVQAATKEVTDAWVEAKPTVLRLNGKQNVQNILKKSHAASDEFIEAIISKLPMLDRVLGQVAGQRSKEMLHHALTAYS